MTWEPSLDSLVRRARSLVSAGERRVLGIAGQPGAGKSTLAAAVVDAVGPDACYVPMDGFHLANAELERLGRRGRKGAPDTFDAAGYVAMLHRLRDRRDEIVYAPVLRRETDEPVAGAIAVPRRTPLIVTEGNYLLLDEGPWAEVAELLDDAWYVDGDEDVRLELLVRRHVRYGMPADAARAWALGPDQRNAELVAGTRHRADLVVIDHYATGAASPDRHPEGDQPVAAG